MSFNQYYPYMYGQNCNVQPYQTQQYIPQQQVPQQSYPTIIGKIVENQDVVKISEVPIGGYGVFPLSDYSKVVVKSYDKDGNLQYLTYNLESPVQEEDIYGSKLDDIYSYLAKLEKKIDGFSKPSSPTPMKKRRQEVDDDE